MCARRGREGKPFRAFVAEAGRLAGRRLDRWEPVWAAAERAGMVLGFHIGTGGGTVVFRGPGGAPSSTTWRRPIPACAWCRTWSRAVRSTATRT